VNVLRDAMCVDTLDPCGVYFGTTGGQVYASADAGDSWAPIVRDLPAVLSVEGAGAAVIRVVLPPHLRTLARGHRRGDRSTSRRPCHSRVRRCSMPWKPAIRCCAERSATT